MIFLQLELKDWKDLHHWNFEALPLIRQIAGLGPQRHYFNSPLVSFKTLNSFQILKNFQKISGYAQWYVRYPIQFDILTGKDCDWFETNSAPTQDSLDFEWWSG